MLYFHKVRCTEDDVETYVHVAYDAPDGRNIFQLINDAALDYRLAMYQKVDDLTGMSYIDFIRDVPNEFCEKHGFTKCVLENTDQVFDGKLLCMTSREVTRQFENQQKSEQYDTAFNKIYAALGRRLEPAMRKSTAMADWTFYQITKQMLLWAKEYATAYVNMGSDGPSERDFVDSKLALVRQSEHLEPPENTALPA